MAMTTRTSNTACISSRTSNTACILEGLNATGIYADGHISVDDIYVLQDWIRVNRYAEFVAAHGDDDQNLEYGMHLVQNLEYGMHPRGPQRDRHLRRRTYLGGRHLCPSGLDPGEPLRRVRGGAWR